MDMNKICVLCNEKIDDNDMGHNAEPIKTGRCCIGCNTTKVIPARLKALTEFDELESKYTDNEIMDITGMKSFEEDGNMRIRIRNDVTLKETIDRISAQIKAGEIKNFEGFKKIVIWGNGTVTIDV